MGGVIKPFGILYVAFMEHFEAQAESAAWILGLANFSLLAGGLKNRCLYSSTRVLDLGCAKMLLKSHYKYSKLMLINNFSINDLQFSTNSIDIGNIYVCLSVCIYVWKFVRQFAGCYIVANCF